LPFFSEKLLLLLSLHLLLSWNSSSSNQLNNDPSSTQSNHRAQHTKQQVQTKNKAPIKRKVLKERTKG
jgi:hypothetical protein